MGLTYIFYSSVFRKIQRAGSTFVGISQADSSHKVPFGLRDVFS